MRQEAFEKFVVQNRKKYDAINLSAAFTGRVCELLQVSMTEMIDSPSQKEAAAQMLCGSLLFYRNFQK